MQTEPTKQFWLIYSDALPSYLGLGVLILFPVADPTRSPCYHAPTGSLFSKDHSLTDLYQHPH